MTSDHLGAGNGDSKSSSSPATAAAATLRRHGHKQAQAVPASVNLVVGSLRLRFGHELDDTVLG